MNDASVDLIVRVVLCGESGVGKTNLLLRYIKNTFDASTKPTIGIDFLCKEIKIGAKTISVQYFDTAGQEKFRSISNTYFKNSQGVILVYDITDRPKFDKLDSWIHDAQSNTGEQIDFLLIGNKTDLEKDRQISTQEGERLAKAHGMLFMEVSALSNADDCVNKAFDLLVNQIVERTLHKSSLAEEEEIAMLKAENLYSARIIKKRESVTKGSSCC